MLPVRRSIYQQFTRRLCIPALGVLILAIAGAVFVSYQNQLSTQRNQHEQLLDTYANVLNTPLRDCDEAAVEEIIHSIIQLPLVKGVSVRSTCTGGELHTGEIQQNTENVVEFLQKELVYADTMKQKFFVGSLGIYFHATPVFKDTFDVLWPYLVIITSMALSIALGSMMSFRSIIGRPLRAFCSAINTQTLARECEALNTSLSLLERNDELTDVVKAYDVLLDQLLEQKKKLQMQARRDPLTGLGNRMVLEEELTSAIQRAIRYRKSGYVLLFDLDEFKPINDRLGHAAGDAVLQAVAQRLLDSVRSIDTVVRLGGDEFVVVLCEEVHAASDNCPCVVIENIMKKLGAPMEYEGHAIEIKASVGSACFPHDGKDSASLLAQADHSMYANKIARKFRH